MHDFKLVLSSTFGRICKSWKLLLATSFILSIAYITHKPLPENLTQRDKMRVLEPIMRIIYYYPVKMMNYLGFYGLHVHYSRLVLNFSAYFTNKLAKFLEPNDSYKVLDTIFNQVPVRVYIPSQPKNNGSVFFIHGGGYVLFNVHSYSAVTAQICIETGMVVISVDYRLAPEYVFPTALEDCQTALVSLMTSKYKTLGIDPSKIVIMGDSAGGTMAAVLARRFKDKFSTYPLKAQILIYPLTQMLDLLTPSYQYANNYTKGTSLLDTEMIAIWMLLYLGYDPANWPYMLANGHYFQNSDHFQKLITQYSQNIDHNQLPFINQYNSRTSMDPIIQQGAPKSDYNDSLIEKLFDPNFSPLLAPRGTLEGCPTALIITCEYDPLRDDGYWYYKRLKDEGVNVQWIHYDEGFHGLMNLFNEIQLGHKLLQKAAQFTLMTLGSV